MNPILKKLQFKGQSPVLLLRAPAEFAPVAAELGVEVHTTAARKNQGKYEFAMAFARSLAECGAIAATLDEALAEKAVCWVGYPKGTSKKYKKADINRDTAAAFFLPHGLEIVSIVALDEDWSAMRYKVLP